ncbi:hypothetical protein AAHH79_37100, partial [Burkholderia pseudomallei]
CVAFDVFVVDRVLTRCVVLLALPVDLLGEVGRLLGAVDGVVDVVGDLNFIGVWLFIGLICVGERIIVGLD